jgi:hypothetical protein
MARVRPARNGPMLRHRNAPSKPASAVNGQSAATTKRLVSPVAIDRLVRIKNGNPLPPCSRTQEAWSALWNIDLQSVCPADLQSAETRTADNMSVGRTGHSPMFRVIARASVVFFNGILGAPAAIFRFAFDDAGYYRRTSLHQSILSKPPRLND